MAVRKVRQGLVLALAAMAFAGGPWSAWADESVPAGKSAENHKSVQVLVSQGTAALEVKSYAAARDAFADALTLEPGNSNALVGEALARMDLGESAKASEIIDRAVNNSALNRAAVINAAVIHMRAKDPMRAARILRTFLSAPATAHDERAYDLFITALSQFSTQAKANPFYQSCQTFAAAYADKLAKDHPGQKLWGVDWLAVDEADQKNSDFKAQQSAINEGESNVASLDKNVVDAQARYNAMERAYQSRMASRYALDGARNRLSDLQRQEKRAKDAVDDALAKAEQPPLLESVDPMIPGESDRLASSSTPPSVSAGPIAPPSPVTPPTVPPPVPPGPPTDVAQSQPVDPPKKVAVTNYAVACAIAPNLAITDASAVKGSNSFSLQRPDGTVVQGTLVRTDPAGKLALLHLNKRVAYLDVASTFTGGPVSCTGFPDVDIFNPAAEAIPGSAPAPGAALADWQIKLNKHPRLGGAPLTVTGGKLVGIELAARDSTIAKIPAVSLEGIRTFVGSDLPAPGHGTANPSSAIFQLVSTSSDQ